MKTDSLFDPIRQKWVSATPEEKLRQQVISWLLGSGGFSKHELLVEKSLDKRLGFISGSERRFDIACIHLHSTHDIQWLLLIECKAKISSLEQLQQAQRQLQGYASNLKLMPHTLALASPEGCWYCKKTDLRDWFVGLPKRDKINVHS